MSYLLTVIEPRLLGRPINSLVAALTVISRLHRRRTFYYLQSQSDGRLLCSRRQNKIVEQRKLSLLTSPLLRNGKHQHC